MNLNRLGDGTYNVVLQGSATVSCLWLSRPWKIDGNYKFLDRHATQEPFLGGTSRLYMGLLVSSWNRSCRYMGLDISYTLQFCCGQEPQNAKIQDSVYPGTTSHLPQVGGRCRLPCRTALDGRTRGACHCLPIPGRLEPREHTL